jgi:hypothetical protein
MGVYGSAVPAPADARLQDRLLGADGQTDRLIPVQAGGLP